MTRWFKHLTVIFAALFLCLGVPILMFGNISLLSASGSADAVSSASVELPEQPSGDFVVYINTDKLALSKDQWKTFFSGEDAGVIMDDIICRTIDTDASGIQLAQRFQARLAENQMRLRKENGLLLASKAENGLYDVLIASKEMDEMYDLQTIYGKNAELVEVRGE